MKRTWVVLIISVIVLIIAFVFFIFPGYYFTLESMQTEATPSCAPTCSSFTPPPTTSFVTPSYYSGTPIPSGSSHPIPSSSQSSSSLPSDSNNPSSSITASEDIPSQSGDPEGGGFLEKMYNKEAREGEVKTLSASIANPVVGVAVAATVAAFVLNPLLSLLFNFPFRDILYFLFNSFFEFLGIRKRRRPWGVVYDSLNKNPIFGTVVKVIEADSGRVRETKVTDRDGRFGFLVGKGKYRLTVAKNGYIFPSKKIILDKNGSDGYFVNIYLGGVFSLGESFLSKNIPLDSAKRQVSSRYFILFLRLTRFFERFRLVILVVGTITILINLYLFRSVFDLIIFLVYIFFWIYEIIQRRKTKPYGEVKDENGGPLDLVVVRLFTQENNKLVVTSITNKKGRFFILAPPGRFYLTASKGGYFLSTLKNVHISTVNPQNIKILMKRVVKSE